MKKGCGQILSGNTNPLSLANFVGSVVGFLNVCKIRLAASSLPSRYPLKAKWYKSCELNSELAAGL
jgi:hypothetical protein